MAQTTPTHASGFHLVTVEKTGHEEESVTPSMRLYLPRVEARLRGIIALKSYVAS